MAFIGFTGKQDQLLDDKKRISIPAKWREHFDAPAYLTSGEEPCIAVYTRDAFEARAQEVLNTSPDEKIGRDQRRKYFGDAHDVAKDASGRLTIPPALIEHAGLKKELVVVGAGGWFEIWDKAAWAQYTATPGGEE